MWEVLIGLLCCLGMAGSLFGYLRWYKKKYNKGKDPHSLSSTFYKTGWKFRVLLISLALWMIYPVLLGDGIYTSGGWMYYAPYTLISWSKVAYAIAMGGIIGVALNAYGNWPNENRAHVLCASTIASIGAIAGSVLRKEWYIGVVVWLAWLLYYVWKNYRNNKAGNPNAWGLYIELVALYSTPSCLAIYILLNYFFLAK